MEREHRTPAAPGSSWLPHRSDLSADPVRSTVRGRLACLASLLLLLTLTASVPATAAPRSPRVSIDKGLVAGASADGVDRFPGIPYAAPPVGAGRWQPLAPATAWTGTRSATSPVAACSSVAARAALG
ncbi:carboxylesterase family protein [Streptomyces sp. NPDC013455]|uniref:carboxylesterase family protein n=1 Tax=Streptomyces sp. NPDC013455 TaxID=3155605 RepID=UPI0034093DCC